MPRKFQRPDLMDLFILICIVIVAIGAILIGSTVPTPATPNDPHILAIEAEITP